MSQDGGQGGEAAAAAAVAGLSAQLAAPSEAPRWGPRGGRVPLLRPGGAPASTPHQLPVSRPRPPGPRSFGGFLGLLGHRPRGLLHCGARGVPGLAGWDPPQPPGLFSSAAQGESGAAGSSGWATGGAYGVWRKNGLRPGRGGRRCAVGRGRAETEGPRDPARRGRGWPLN